MPSEAALGKKIGYCLRPRAKVDSVSETAGHPLALSLPNQKAAFRPVLK